MKQPHIQCTNSDIAPNVLIAGDPARVLRAAKYLFNWKEIAYHREFRTVTGEYKGIPVTITSTGIGGASTAIAMEELIICGAKRIIRIGSTGALQSYIKCGDLIIASAAVRQEGTSQKYVPLDYPAIADPLLYHGIRETCFSLGFTHYGGIIQSHDSLYSDNQQEIEAFWHNKQVLAADMETSVVFVLGSLRGIQACSILNVVVEYTADTKEGISNYQKTMEGESRQINLALESLLQIKHNWEK